jgi:hypothetical protein
MDQAVNADGTLAPEHGSPDFAAVGLPLLGSVGSPGSDDFDVFVRKSRPKEAGNQMIDSQAATL